LNGTKTASVDTGTGVATFTDLSIDKAGVGYTLTATGSTVSTTPGVVVSDAFDVTTPSKLTPAGVILIRAKNSASQNPIGL